MQTRVRRIWTLALAGGAALAVGCGGSGSGGLGTVGEKVTLGAACDVGDSINASSVLAANPEALECSSKLCLYPPRDRTTATGPFCTAPCAADDDCAQGQVRTNAPDDHRCEAGFVCRILVPKLENNPLACKPLCVCRDFLTFNDTYPRPPTCPLTATAVAAGN